MAAAEQLKKLGRYDLTGVLGKGAMGVVYEGLDPRLNRKVAIKTIIKGHLDDEAASKEYSMRFMREAQSVARLNHAHIVQVYDFGEEGEIAYIVMEFIKGKELKNFFDANERFELKEAVRIMCELLDALELAHEAGIVHRDIKPANVMLDSQAHVKLADFGVARVTDSSATEKTQAGTMVGTPAYMSPEQITGGNVDRRSDVFSAGIILYQFLTGDKPFTGSGAWTIAKKIIQDHPPLPSSINNTISPLFDAVVNKALAKNVEQRYQSAREFGVALKRALEGKAGEDESDKTMVVSAMANLGSIAKPSAQMATASHEATKGASTGSQEVELEFWRAIKDGNDPDDFDLYVQQFPNGIYAALAKRKIAKLRGIAPEETGTKAKQAAEQEKKEAEDAAKREADVKQKLAEEKAKLEAQLAQREAEYKKREAEQEAKRLAEAKARAEADARREAEMARREAEAKTRAAAEEKARQEAIERAKKEAQAELAKKEAEYQKREADARAKAEGEAKARRELEEKAKKEAEIRAKADTETRAKREAEEKARREADAKARAEAEARAKKEAEELAKRQAEIKKREAEMAKREAEGPKAKAPVVPMVIAMVVVIGLAGGGWYYYTAGERARVVALTAALETATKATQELNQAKQHEVEAQKQLVEAKLAEEAARKAGDTAKLKELQEATKRAEAEAQKQAGLVKQREAAAKKAQDDATKVKQEGDKKADAAKQEAIAKAEAAKREAEAKTAQAQQAQQAQPAQPTQQAQPTKQAQATKQAQPTQPAQQTAKVDPPKAKTRSEREAERDAEVAAKAIGKPAEQIAAVSPSITAPSAAAPSAAAVAAAPAAPAAKAGSDIEAMYQQALAMEKSGKAADAVRIYRRAARAGHGKAAKRLGDIFDRGVPGVSRDYAESLQWYQTARELGETVELSGKR
jgi:serine/threonine-protein kinase